MSELKPIVCRRCERIVNTTWDDLCLKCDNEERKHREHMSILKSNTRTDSALLDRVYSEAEKVFKGTLWEPSVMSRFKRIITKLKQEGS